MFTEVKASKPMSCFVSHDVKAFQSLHILQKEIFGWVDVSYHRTIGWSSAGSEQERMKSWVFSECNHN